MPAKKTAPAKKAAPAKKTAPAKTTARKAAPAKKAAPNTKPPATAAKKAAAMTEAVVDNVANVVSPDTLVDFLTELRDLIDAKLADARVEKKAAAKKTPAKHAAAPEPEDDEDDDEFDEEGRRAELNKMKIAALRTLASEAGYEDDDVAGATKEQLIDAIIDAEMNPDDDEDSDDDDDADDSDEDEDDDESEEEDDDADDDGDEEDEDEEEDEAEEEDEDEELDRDDLNAMGLRELKALAKDRLDLTNDDLKGKDKDTIIDMLLGDDADEDDDDEDEDGEDYYTVDELKAMPENELKALAKEWKVKLPPKATKAQIVKILAEVE